MYKGGNGYSRISQEDKKRHDKIDAITRLKKAVKDNTDVMDGGVYNLKTTCDIGGYGEQGVIGKSVKEIHTVEDWLGGIRGIYFNGEEERKIFLHACAVWQLDKLTNHIIEENS